MISSTVFRTIVVLVFLAASIDAGVIHNGHWLSTLVTTVTISLLLYSFYGANFKRGVYHYILHSLNHQGVCNNTTSQEE